MKSKITDVARLAGVSSSTVSHVINKTRFVSESTTQKVLDAINELGYTPDVSAQVFKTGKKMMIGFLVPDIKNPFFALLIECVENVVSEQGYRLVVANARDSVEMEKNVIRNLVSGVVDGLIIATSAESIEEIEEVIPQNFPVVFVDRILKNYEQDSVELDVQDATIQMISDLIDQGHRKIGYIVGLSQISSTRDRVRAYCEAFSRKGLPCDKSLIRFLDRSTPNSLTEIEELIKKDCTALIGTYTNITHEILNYIESSDAIMKKNIAVCGFSDSYLAERFEKKIPVVNEPMEAMGIRAGEMILRKIASPSSAFPIEKLTCTYLSNH